jgi:carboxymethylenebutenolidase
MASESTVVSRDYLVPPEHGKGAGILVLHSGRGQTDFIKQFCHRLAREGYVALAPDLFDGRQPQTVEESRTLKQELDPDQKRRELEDAAEFLKQYSAVSRAKIGVIGIGYGAEWLCRIAPRLGTDAGGLVLFYGYEATDWSTVTAPVLGHFAQLDQEIPESKVNAIRDDLRDADVEHDLFSYPHVEPSFFETDQSARHDPDAAKLAWERTREFIRLHLSRLADTS